MSLRINDEFFGVLLPFVKDEFVTDITWNGRDLWLDDLKKGRYKSDVKLSDQFVSTFSTRIANLANKNFNLSEPLLEAETDDLRISIIDGTVTNTKRSIAIRKTPAVRRLNEANMLKGGYAEAMVIKLLEALVKGHSSIIVTGDVGSGKTELIKYLTKFIPPYERAISIEDNYELRLSAINPKLDCVEIKATMDGPFSYQSAIKAALRQLCKWLLMAEARSKEVINLLEAASTGCIVMTTLHSDDVRKIPDRVVNMMGIDGEEKRNDVFNFFDVGIKVGIQKTDQGIKRSIDQICVMDRDNDENSLYLIYNKGFTGQPLPKNIWKKVQSGAKEQASIFEFLKPDNADAADIIETPEFAQMVKDLEEEMKEGIFDEVQNETIMNRFGTTETEEVDDLIEIFDEMPELPVDISEVGDIFDAVPETPTDISEIGSDIFDELPPPSPSLEDLLGELEDMPEVLSLEEAIDLLPADIFRDGEHSELADLSGILEDVSLDNDDWRSRGYDSFYDAINEEYEEPVAAPEAEEREEEVESPEDINDVIGLFDQLPIFEEFGGIAFEGIDFEKLKNLSGAELIAELKKQLTMNWLNSLSEEELADELKREIEVVEKCNKMGIPIPEHELIKIRANIERK